MGKFPYHFRLTVLHLHLHLQAFRGAIHHKDTMVLTIKYKSTHKKAENKRVLIVLTLVNSIQPFDQFYHQPCGKDR